MLTVVNVSFIKTDKYVLKTCTYVDSRQGGVLTKLNDTPNTIKMSQKRLYCTLLYICTCLEIVLSVNYFIRQSQKTQHFVVS